MDGLFSDMDPNRDLLAELMNEVDTDDWLAPLNENFQATQLEDIEMKRSRSSPTLAQQQFGTMDDMHTEHQWGTSTTPMAIRPTRRSQPEDYSSLDSAQSFLGGVQTEDTFLGGTRRSASFRSSGSGIPPIHPSSTGGRSSGSMQFQQKPNSMPSRLRSDATGTNPTVTIPAKGGHWAWIPEPTPDGVPPAPPPFQPPTNMDNVPVNSGRLPLPSLNSSIDEFDLLGLDVLENFDVMEMANTLVLEPGSQRISPSRMHGSCPLPTLLEDALSVEADGSDSTMQRSSSPSTEGADKLIYAHTHDVTVKGGRARNTGVPIPGPRSNQLKVQRPTRSQSSPHMTTSLLASSCPTHHGDRPVRGAARRSIAAVQFLSDATDEFDPDFLDEYTEYGHKSLRRTNSSGSIKKKHNPWTREETMALIAGVRAAGIGKWAEIKRLTIPGIADVLESRSPVDLKDKWRNLTRIAKLSKSALKARLQRGPNDIPYETMLLVKDLMENGQQSDQGAAS